MIPVHDKNGVTIYHGDNVEIMRSLPVNSVDSIVTDPPYGIRFMGKAWDGVDIEKQTAKRREYKDGPSPKGGHNSVAAHAGQYNTSLSSNQAFAEWTRVWAVEALRILKPGGHMLVFCGPRTYHRMACGVEDAGFEIRDQIMWIYGSGFPKSLDVSKALDEAAGAEREVIEEIKGPIPGDHGGGGKYGHGIDRDITEPSTEFAKEFDGWGTALKPAHEPIVVARKPLIGKVIDNVLEHGTGAINIDASRIENDKGRFPANIIFNPEAAEILDRQSGQVGGGYGIANRAEGKGKYGDFSGADNGKVVGFGDSGGASRFFYVAKASQADRDEGLEGFPEQKAGIKNDSGRGFSETDPYAEILRRNNHPTVKPTLLMQYLVRLVTPIGGTVLDMFMGSGSTGKAAVREKFKFIGMEREGEYIPISIARINAPAQVELF